MDFAMQQWLEKATVVFPVSESTAAEAKIAFPRVESKLVTVPHGSEWRGKEEGSAPEGSVYFLTPAGMTPNKNHAGLLAAAIQLWREGLDFRLVWTGPRTDAVTATVDSDLKELAQLQALYREHLSLVGGRLEGLGFVADKKLNSLYQNTRRVVLPSKYEGFGLPVMEAFERGLKVICTDISPFVEQVDRYQMRDRVNLVSVESPTALVDAMRAALLEVSIPADSAEEMELRRRVESWTWDDAAQLYAKTLRDL